MAHETPKLQASARDRLGTRYSRRLRRDGLLPAVMYGHGEAPAHVALNHEQFMDCLHHGAHLLEIASDAGTGQTCLIKEVQYDYLGTNIIHVDLTRVDLTEEVHVTIPIVVQGEEECPGLQMPGALLDQPMVDIEVICLANAIPGNVVADVSKLEVGDSVLVRDVSLPEGVRTEHEDDEVIVTIAMSKVDAEEEEEAPTEAASAEPEVIMERKEGEEQEGEGGGGEED